MKAIVCNEPFSLTLADRAMVPRAAGEASIRIERVGLCGTDYHIYSGNQPFLDYPRVMGHELAGTVVDTDSESDFDPGQLVTINPYLPCGNCVACRKGKPNCCVRIEVLGVHRDGGMTEMINVPAAALIAVDGLSPDQAAMVEFLSVGAHAVRRGNVAAGDRVLVTGAGPIGVGVALFAQARGADVVQIDTSAERLAYAQQKVGISTVIQVGDDIAARLSDRTSGEFFDIVFDATGNARAIEQGFAYVAHGGTYVLVSVVKDRLSFSDPEFHKREMSLLGSRNATREDFEFVIDAICTGLVPSEVLHTHSFAIEDMPQEMPALIAAQAHVLKAIGHF